MATMRPPTIPDKPVPVIPPDDLRKLLRACEGRDFHALRDTAIIRLVLEPGGMRRAEIARLTVDAIDLENDTALVVGKGRRSRAIPYGHRTGQALTRYLRARMQHPQVKLHPDVLWLAQKGPLTDNGLGQMLERRCAQAGIAGRSTRISCGTPRRTCGCPSRAATRPAPCGCSGGVSGRCCSATRRQQRGR